MFGMNEIVGKGHFTKSAEAQAGKLLVTSMFFTLQGEGPYRGEPAFFIRLAKCNLACSFCDTYFDSGEWLSVEEIAERVDREIIKFFSKGMTKEVPVASDAPALHDPDDLDTLIHIPYKKSVPDIDSKYVPNWALHYTEEMNQNYQRHRRKMVLVITGGEPTLQANLLQLLQWGEDEFEKTQIESNGIVINENTVPDSTTVVVSPKCTEKLMAFDVRVPNVIFNKWGFKLTWGSKIEIQQKMVPTAYKKPSKTMLERADCLKFVMEAPDPNRSGNKSPYCSIPDWAIIWAHETGKPLFISPMNIYKTEPKKAKELRAAKTETTIEERSYNDEVISFWEEGLLDMAANQRNHEYAAKYAIQYGFIFNVQIHLLASVA